MEIKVLDKSHASILYEVEKRCFSKPWTEAMFSGDLESESTIYLGAFSDGILVGYAGAWLVAGDADITNVAVIPEKRGQGIAQKLLSELFSRLLENAGEIVRLEVRRSNENAKKLYEKLGFSEIAVRKNYYADPKEDALIYEKNL